MPIQWAHLPLARPQEFLMYLTTEAPEQLAPTPSLFLPGSTGSLTSSTASMRSLTARLSTTLNDGSVALTDLGGAAAEGTQDAIDEAAAKLMRGEIHVFDTATFTVDGKAVESYMADVDTDAAYEGDHEVIVQGDYGDTYFDESGEGFRSAPFFDIQIDGITLLDTAF